MSAAVDLARALDPVFMAADCGIDCDAWQQRFLRSRSTKLLLNIARQVGKSTVSAVKGLHVAIYDAPALVLAVSPSLRQSTELYEKVSSFRARLKGAPAATQDSATSMTLANG